MLHDKGIFVSSTNVFTMNKDLFKLKSVVKSLKILIKYKYIDRP